MRGRRDLAVAATELNSALLAAPYEFAERLRGAEEELDEGAAHDVPPPTEERAAFRWLGERWRHDPVQSRRRPAAAVGRRMKIATTSAYLSLAQMWLARCMCTNASRSARVCWSMSKTTYSSHAWLEKSDGVAHYSTSWHCSDPTKLKVSELSGQRRLIACDHTLATPERALLTLHCQ